MKRKPPILIVAVDESGGFGKDGKIPWHLPEDLKRFKVITDGHICVMGRHTYKDILTAREIRDAQKGIKQPIAQVLRGRDSFVVTSCEDLIAPGVTKIKHWRELYYNVPITDRREVFIIGGRRMFIDGLAWCEKIYMTIVKGPTYDCDVVFPIEVLNKKWKIVSGEETDKAYFVVYNRK